MASFRAHFMCMGGSRTSEKSTQNAFMFRPYRKLAKDSLNRARLSCISWKCIMLASKSATASDSSPKAGSNSFKGNEPSPSPALRAESRKEDRDDGRSGVVGRELRVLELGRLSLASGMLSDIIHLLPRSLAADQES